MKILLVAASLATTSIGRAQPAQKPVFYPPTLHEDKIKVDGDTQTQVIERRTIILLGFLPPTSGGEARAKTAPLSSHHLGIRLNSKLKSRNSSRDFGALKAELLTVQNPKFRPEQMGFNRWRWGMGLESRSSRNSSSGAALRHDLLLRSCRTVRD